MKQKPLFREMIRMKKIHISRSTLVILIQLFILLVLTISLCIKSREAAAESTLLSEQEDALSGTEAGEKKEDYIHWVDFTLTSEIMEKAFRLDINSCREELHFDWIELLAWLGARYGGDFSRFKQADLDGLIEKLRSGETMESITKDMKYYSYYHEAYTAVLGGMVGYFDQEIDDGSGSGAKKWVKKYGLKTFSPIAYGFPYSDYDDFGVSRSYGYRRQHLGHDMMGQTGTPIFTKTYISIPFHFCK
jgi:hypothetical protein